MSYICDKCKEEFHFRDEVILLCDNMEVEDEDHGGSGDIDMVLCNSCYEDEIKENK